MQVNIGFTVLGKYTQVGVMARQSSSQSHATTTEAGISGAII